jgi:hypothetical protein
MARKLRDAADDPRDVTSIESLVHNIHRWEGGGSGVSERYRLLYCRVFARTEFELFGIEPPSIITELSGKSTPPAADIPAGTVTSEDPSGNRYVVLVLPPGPQRIVIDVTSTDAGGEPGGFGILVLLAVTAVAVIAFFGRDSRGEGAWPRLIAPALAAVLLTGLVVLAVLHYNTLLGVPPGNPAAWALPASYAVVAAAGLGWGLVLKVRRPQVYATIGLGAHAVTGQLTPARPS